jgi:hypothetical protein
MANPAKDARDKVQANWPGAQVRARGRKFIKHAHPTEPRRYSLDTHIGPIHYGPMEDKEIDTAWQASAQGFWDYEVVENNFHCFVRDSVPVGYRYLDVATGEDVELEVDAVEWVNELDQRENITNFSQVTPNINDDSITWPSIAAGWDVTVQAQTARLAKKINIDTLANLGSPTIGGTIDFSMSFRFQKTGNLDIYVDGALWDENTDETTSDNIEFRLGTESVFWFKRPWAADADGEQFNGSMAVRKTGANLFVEVRIPWTWLQAATFPVEIDPSVDEQVGAGADDAHEQQNSTQFSSSAGYLQLRSNTADANSYNVGMRFQGVLVPKDATIGSGTYWEGYYNLTTNDDADFDIWCEAVDDAVDFATNADVTSRTKTSASAGPYTASDIAAGGNTWYGSAIDASAPIQEVINRSGWESGRDLCIIGKGSNRTTTSSYLQAYDGDPGTAPKLHIEWTEVQSDTVVAVDRVACDTSTGEQAITVSAGGLTPKAALFFLVGATVDGTAAADAVFSRGAATGPTNRWVAGMYSKDAVTTSETQAWMYHDSCVKAYDGAATPNLLCEADFVSFGVNTVTINWSTAPASAWFLTVVTFSGSDVSAHANYKDVLNTVDLEINVTDPGFEPDIIFVGNGTFNSPGLGTHGDVGYGIVHNDGAGTVTQRAFHTWEQDTRTTMRVSGANRDDSGVVTLATTLFDNWIEFSNFDSSGFSMTARDDGGNNREHQYLAISFGGSAQAAVGSYTTPTSSGSDSETGVGFKPQFLLTLNTFHEAVNTVYDDTTDLGGQRGLSAITAANQYSMSWVSDSGVGTTNVESLNDDVALELPDEDGSAGLTAAFTSFDASGWTWNFSNFESNAKYLFWLAIGESTSLYTSPFPGFRRPT